MVIGPHSLLIHTHLSSFTAAPFIITTHWPESNFAWTHAEPHAEYLDLLEIAEKPWKRRWRCKSCGCTVASYNSQTKKWVVCGTQFDRNEVGEIVGWDTIKPTAHIFYGTRLIDVLDNLEKWTGYEEKSERIS